MTVSSLAAMHWSRQARSGPAIVSVGLSGACGSDAAGGETIRGSGTIETVSRTAEEFDGVRPYTRLAPSETVTYRITADTLDSVIVRGSGDVTATGIDSHDLAVSIPGRGTSPPADHPNNNRTPDSNVTLTGDTDLMDNWRTGQRVRWPGA